MNNKKQATGDVTWITSTCFESKHCFLLNNNEYNRGCALPTETTSALAFCFALATLGIMIFFCFNFCATAGLVHLRRDRPRRSGITFDHRMASRSGTEREVKEGGRG